MNEPVAIYDEQILKDLAANRPDVVVYDHQRKKLLYVSPQISSLLGLLNGATLADVQPYLNRLAEADRAFIQQHAEMLEAGDAHVEFEIDWPVKERNVPLSISVSRLINRYWLVFISDMGVAKDYENYLVEFGIKKNTTLDSVLHFVSGAIALTQHFYAEAGRNLDASDNDNVKDMLELIYQNSKHCLEVINNVSRAEHDRSPYITVKTSRMNVAQRIQYILDDLYIAYPERHFVFSPGPAAIVIEADEFKFLQIVNNFVFNAIKYSSPDESIEIRISTEADHVIVSVADQGIGIPADLQPYVFDRHTTAGRAGLNGEPSHGIGLSICKNLATLMKGRVWFESTVGEGSTFYVSLPRR